MSLMIYGATGYTGTLMSEQARARGLDFVVAGRDPAKVAALANRLGVAGRSFSIDDAAAVRKNLEGVACVLHAAGPFGKTARQMMDACIAAKAHYLDITGEFKVFALAESWNDKANAAGVMLMPGAGWDVVPSDCLALHAARRAKSAQTLRLFLQHAGPVSRGSAASGGEIFGIGGRVRRGGAVVETNEQKPEMADFGKGPEHCIPLPMGDVITAWKSARIPNIEVCTSSEQSGLLAV